MSVVQILDDVTTWARENICSKVALKMPPADDSAAVDADYTYKLVTPAAFTLYVPTKDKLPPKVPSPIPSLCVRFIEGREGLAAEGGDITIQFAFSTWDVGLHGEDIYKAQADGSFARWSGEEAAAYFSRASDGWRDAWNFVDTALRAIESTTGIAGCYLDRQSPIEYGPLSDQEGIPDYYPYWFCWVNFTLRYPITRNTDDINTYL